MITLTQSHNLEKFVGKGGQGAINRINLNLDAQCVEATDGRMFIRVPLALSPDVQTGTFAIPPDVVANMLAWGDTICVETLDRDGEQIKATYRAEDDMFAISNTVQVGETTDKFPDLLSVVPKAEPTLTVHLSINLLAKIFQYAKATRGDVDAVKCYFIDSKKLVQFIFTNKEGKKVLIGLLPWAEEDKHESI